MSQIQIRFELLSRDLDRLEGWARAAQLDSNVSLQRDLVSLRRQHRAIENQVNACSAGAPTLRPAIDLELEDKMRDIAAGAKRAWSRMTQRY